MPPRAEVVTWSVRNGLLGPPPSTGWYEYGLVVMSGTPNEVDGGVVDALLLKRPWRSSYKSSLVRNDDDGESGTDWAGDMRS